jgi:pectin methylesterase-like acyl-CoA thioesterase
MTWSTRSSAALLSLFLLSSGCDDDAAAMSGDRAGRDANSSGAGGHAASGGAATGGLAGSTAGDGAAVSEDAGREPAEGEDAGLDQHDGGTSGVVLPDFPPHVAALFPPREGAEVCPDASLRIRFARAGADAAPALGTSGAIEVRDVDQPDTPVARIDMSATTWSDTIGGQTFNTMRPVHVDGDEVVIYLPSHALRYAHHYSVTVQEGAILAPSGEPLVIVDPGAWRFATAGQAPSGSKLRVAHDGSGQFCSVQGALDSIALQNTAPITLELARGVYREIIYFRDKDNLTLQGEARDETIIAAVNNNTLNAGTAKRALFGVDSVTGLTLANLTIANLTPQGGSQAEALRLQGCDRCVVRDTTITSTQDTLLWSGGRVFARNCLITGNVDFVWGGGVAYFERCEIRTVHRAGATVTSRNAAGAYGYVFVDSRMTSDPGITNHALARIDVAAYPASHVAFINCELGAHIAPTGWTITGSDTSMLRFWEYKSVDPTGALIDVSQRRAGSRQLSREEAAQMRDPSVVLGGWQVDL